MADESHADILAEMRRCVESHGTKRRENIHLSVRTWLGLIERLENAHKRETPKKPLGYWANGVHYTDVDELRKVLDADIVPIDQTKNLNQIFLEFCKEMKDMKLILIDGKRKFEVLPASKCDRGQCDYAKHDVKYDKKLFCEKRCYVPQKYQKFIFRAYTDGFALREICPSGKETNGDA